MAQRPEQPQPNAQQLLSEIETLPDETLLHIAQYLPSLTDLAALRATSHTLRGPAEAASEEAADGTIQFWWDKHLSDNGGLLQPVASNPSIEQCTEWMLLACSYLEAIDNGAVQIEAPAQAAIRTQIDTTFREIVRPVVAGALRAGTTPGGTFADNWERLNQDFFD